MPCKKIKVDFVVICDFLNIKAFRAFKLIHKAFAELLTESKTFCACSQRIALCLEKEKNILRAQALEEGKPAAIVDKMVEGRIKTFYEENCLLNQKFVKDSSKTIEQLVIEATAQIGEKISIRRFTRYEMGEGLQKKSENLADEVAAQVAAAKQD